MRYSILFLLLFCSSQIFGEAFTIKDYYVNIVVNQDGSVDVKETIKVNFTESKRGIIRSIPFRYTVPNNGFEEQAVRPKNSSGFYEILLKDVTVKGYESTIYKEGSYQNIRIGSATKYITGEHTYEISYTVWGALNEFEKTVEFNWNIIGTEWATTIDKAHFSIEFEKNPYLKNNDVILVTGERGEQGKNASFGIDKMKRIYGQTKEALPYKNGMSIATRLPKSYFKNIHIPVDEYAKDYYISKQDISMHLNTDGSIDISEVFQLNIKNPLTHFSRHIRGEPHHFDDNSPKDILITDEEIIHSKNLKNTYYHINREGENKVMTLYMDKEVPFKGRQRLEFKYKIWGAVTPLADETVSVKWEALDLVQREPLVKASIKITADPTIKFEQNNVNYSSTNGANAQFQFTFNSEKYSYEGELMRPILSATELELKFSAYANAFDLSNVPLSVYADKFYIKNSETDIYIQKDGHVKFKHKQELHFKDLADFSYTNGFEPYVYSQFPKNKNTYAYRKRPILDMPTHNILGHNYMPVISETEAEGGQFQHYSRYRKSIAWDWERVENKDSSFTYSYTTYGLLKSKGKNYQLHSTVLQTFGEPTARGSVRVHFPDGSSLDNIEYKLYTYHYKNGSDTLSSLRLGGGVLSGLVLGGLQIDECAVLKLQFPKKLITKSNFSAWFNLMYLNNQWLLISVGIGSVLFFLWLLFGRDKRHTLVVQYSPPAGITPAEAGFLWDGKLHRKDLISLIYYWASKGYLSIEDATKKSEKNYKLIKKQNLPSSAKSFEKTMFNQLFKGDRKSVLIRGLRNSFYKTMNKADRELETYGRTKNFFVYGTRGFGAMLWWIGFLLGVFAVLSFGYCYAENDSYALSISSAFASFFFIFFGNHMPKKGHFGTEKYGELLGFREFMVKTDLDKLTTIVKDNPKYFEETIAYAIVFGYGKQWAAKFQDLIEVAPTWYKDKNSSTFSSIDFTASMLESMTSMNEHLNYKYTPPSSSSYSSSSSSSYSSYSSSSGSGSSSFGGGGSSYSSGGGFGGGGGSSW